MSQARIALPIVSGAALPDVALGALQRNQLLTAHFAADRWIRLTGASANNLLVRAEAAHRLGFKREALEDLRLGLGHDPMNRALVLRIAEWEDGAERLDAARLLTKLSRRDAEIGLNHLAQAGEIGAGVLRVESESAVGWLAWRTDLPAELHFESEAGERRMLAPDTGHPFARYFGAALDFRLPWSARPLRRVSLTVGDRTIASIRVSSVLTSEDEDVMDAPETALTVLVPIYDDFEATRDCLETVAREVAVTSHAQALAIDDGTPDLRIRGLLASFAERARCAVVANPYNLGFVAAVNRGLRRLRYSDVVLLNADTLLPPGALARLLLASRAHRSVGILNPLSNHGEFTSYPRPFCHNALDASGWMAIDRAAAHAGAGRVVDIPSATGFCMFITRACLDAVGGLSEAFGDGYLEDADFGLRAREAGFRNVCALSVYVPHLGSRSFKSAKKALVARNRVALARRFPRYEDECRAFVAADPLARGRERLELALASQSPKRRLLLGPARWADALSERADQLKSEARGALVALFERVGPDLCLTLRDNGGCAPQNVTVGPTRDKAVIADALKTWPCDRIEYFWEPGAPAVLASALELDERPHDLVLAAVPRCLDEVRAWPRRDRIIAFDAMAERACETLGVAAEPASRRNRERQETPNGVELAILHPFETLSSRRFLIACARALAARGRTALLIGASGVEDNLIADGLLATGPVRREEWARLLAIYAPRRYVSPYRFEGFWALEGALARAPAPSAFFDATGAGFLASEGDLALDVAAEDANAADAVLEWAFATNAALTRPSKRIYA